MDANERGRKRREASGPREELDSVPPPRRRRVRHELDPEMLWDKETDEDVDEYEADDDFDANDADGSDDGFTEDFDDWDHPVRRLKIN